MRRAYPDTAAIDRDQLAVELDWDSGSLEDGGLRLHHKTERREIADETARPSAWSHWTDLSLAVPAGGGRVVGDLQSEVWQYDYESEAWFDSWRLDGLLGYRWGDILAADWLVGVAAERLDAGDNPDSYHQLGLRAGVESFGLDLAGSLTVEYGRRSYDNATIELSDSSGDTLPFALYSDFGYWKIWFAGSWRIVDAVSLEGLASYEPESHTEQSDDSALGFLNRRLVWRSGAPHVCRSTPRCYHAPIRSRAQLPQPPDTGAVLAFVRTTLLHGGRRPALAPSVTAGACWLGAAENALPPLGEKVAVRRLRECPVCGWRGHRFRNFLSADGAIRHLASARLVGPFDRHRQLGAGVSQGPGRCSPT